MTSVGVCFSLSNSLDDIMQEADKNLYVAKHYGRNQVVISA